jgi:periplasmic protein CpxP/Spy
MRTWILAVMMMTGLAMNAQHGDRRHEGKKHDKGQKEHFTPEQRAELRTKEMTLALDLTDKQQAEIKAFFTERNKEMEKAVAERKANRDAGKKPTNDERFAMKNKMLDERIATKAFMKKTLDARQLAKLEEMKNDKREKITKKGKNFKKGRRR